MNWDLRKAEQALARGERDEARVYAWNALATIAPGDMAALLRIAEELGDELLMLEIERRGVSKPEPPTISRVGMIFRAAFLAVLVAAVVLTMLGARLSEPGSLEPKVEESGSLAPEGLPILHESSGLWLVRIGSSERVSQQKLADDLSFRYRLPVGVLPPMKVIPSYALDAPKRELIGEELLGLLAKWYVAEGSATIIGVTDYDMRSRTLDLSSTFSLRRRAHYGVVSTSGLRGNVPDRLRGNTRYKRTRKLVARNVGFLYLGRAEVDDPHSLLRSPMSGTDDIDALDETL